MPARPGFLSRHDRLRSCSSSSAGTRPFPPPGTSDSPPHHPGGTSVKHNSPNTSPRDPVAQHRLTARQRTRPRHCHTRCLAGRPGSPSRPGWRTGADRSPVAAVTARGSGRVRCCRAPSRRYEPARQHRTCSRQRLVRGTGALLSPGRLDCEPVEVTAPAMPARDLGRFRPYRPQQIGLATEALRRANRTRSSCRAERSFTGR